MGRRIAKHFRVGEKDIQNLEDLEEVLKENPKVLILAAIDGRLKKFIWGYGKLYDDIYGDEENLPPEEVIKRLAQMLGVEVNTEISAKDLDVVISKKPPAISGHSGRWGEPHQTKTSEYQIF